MSEARGRGARRPREQAFAGTAKSAARRRAGWASALPLAAVLASCASMPPSVMLQSASEATMVPSEQAFAVPAPSGPAVISVVQRRHANAMEQEIILAQSSNREGQNFIRIQLFGEAPFRMAEHATIDNNLLDLGELYAEMDEAIPNVGMTVSPFFVQTKYGAFGYAVGYYSNDLCLYAWQRIGEASTRLEDDSQDAAIGLRVRLCKTGATEAQLLEVMYDMTITTYYTGEWAPFGTGILDVIPLQEIRPPRDVLPRPTAPRTTAARATTTVAPVIVPTGPAVPLPPGATGGGTGTGTPTGPTVPLPP